MRGQRQQVARVAAGAGPSVRAGSATLALPRPRTLRRPFALAVVVTTLFLAIVAVGPSGSPAASAVSLTPNWIELTPPPAIPPVRTAASMAYDPATGNTVLFGGDEITSGPNVLLNDTWIWNGTTWTQQFPATSPPALYGASMVYDAAISRLVLFGGVSSSGDTAETWTWDGTTWTQRISTPSPPARSSASMAYDQTAAEVVLFGGLDNRTMLNDTWIWNGTTWTQLHPSAKPSPRYAASMDYDAASGNTVLFGGYNGGQTGLADTWIWNGTTWAAQDPATSATARYGASMAYDPVMSEIVLFGGYDGGQSDLSDMWTWNGTTWAARSPTTSPPARRYATMDYDAGSGDLVLFGGDPGGSGSPSSVNDTWIWGSGGTFTTTPSSGTIVIGASISDVAAVTGNAGAPAPTGSVSFSVCGPTAVPTPCTEPTHTLGSPVTLTPGAGKTATATSTTFMPSSPGYWCFTGSYSGDSDYVASSENGTDECVSVEPSITTTPARATVALGNSDTDGATVFGTPTGGTPTGTVSFYVCGPTTTPTACTSQADPVGAAVTLTAGAGDTATAASPAFVPTAVGDWCFAGVYSGGGAYSPGSDTGTGECVVVTPVFVTAPSSPAIALDSADTDTATVSGNPGFGVPTGTVTFYLCGPTSTPTPCTSQADPVGTPVTVTAGANDTATAASLPVTPDAAGTWCFGAVYSGGGSYAAGSDTTTDECFTVSAVEPAFTSGDTASAFTRQPFTVTITTTGAPTPTISSSALPHWLTLTDNHNGTATLSAVKAHKGKHTITLTAANTAGSVNQTFVLTVHR
jgi:hypothetical protein